MPHLLRETALLQFLLVIVIGGSLLAFGVMFILGNLKRLRIVKAAKGATNEQLQSIYHLVGAPSTEPTTCYVLGRTNQEAGTAENIVVIPNSMGDFPWAGRVVEIHMAEPVVFHFRELQDAGTCLGGWIYLPVAVPCRVTATGSIRSCFSPNRYVAENAALNKELSVICSRYPQELLSYLLCIGTENVRYEPMDQARIGGEPAWMQTPETPYLCEYCQQSLALILQLPGSVLGVPHYHEATFYWLGCQQHSDHTRLVTQYA